MRKTPNETTSPETTDIRNRLLEVCQPKNNPPRIYVACLAAYNNAILHGRWIRCDQTADEIEAEIKAMLDESPIPRAEEWAIHDHENWQGLSVHEYENIADLADAGEFIVEHGSLAGKLLEHHGGLDQLPLARQTLEECYQGAYKNIEEWAEEFLTDTGQLKGLPENLQGYFDFERYARDCDLGGEIFTLDVDGMVHVFWNQ